MSAVPASSTVGTGGLTGSGGGRAPTQCGGPGVAGTGGKRPGRPGTELVGQVTPSANSSAIARVEAEGLVWSRPCHLPPGGVTLETLFAHLKRNELKGMKREEEGDGEGEWEEKWAIE